MGLWKTDYSNDPDFEIVTNWVTIMSRIVPIWNIQSLKGKIPTKAVKYKNSATQMVSWRRDNVLHLKQVSGKFKLSLIVLFCFFEVKCKKDAKLKDILN